MPEGDTLHSIARRVGPALEGRTVVSLSTSDLGTVRDAKGWTVDHVRALGKHLLIAFDAPWVLRTHLGMNGRVWQPRGRKRPSRSVFALEVEGEGTSIECVVCTGAYRTEFVRRGALGSHAILSRLGPDLLAEPPDLEGAVARATDPSHAHREIADVLLDQRIASGIGNVYKSEVLFIQRVHPRQTVGTLSDEALEGLYDTAAHLLRRNLRTRRRTTVPTRRRPYPTSPRLWVYGRAGKPCLECETSVELMRQGDLARSTYFCPRCQGEG